MKPETRARTSTCSLASKRPACIVPVGDALGQRVADLDRRGRRGALGGGVERGKAGRRENGGEHRADETAA